MLGTVERAANEFNALKKGVGLINILQHGFVVLQDVAPRRLDICLQIERDGAAFSTVIVRLVRNCALERTIQYSRDVDK